MRYNKEQRAYKRAQDNLEALDRIHKDMEAEYVKSLGVVNEDGKVPTRTWAIDDDEVADRAIEEFEVILEESGLWAKILAARENVVDAEENLIRYALSIMPQKKEREILREAAKVNYTTRKKIISLAMQLDTATVTR